jgi:hypothetical protein
MSELYNHITPERHWEIIVVISESIICEVLPAASLAAGKLVDQILIVIDLKGFGYISTPILTRLYIPRSPLTTFLQL